MNDIQNIGIFMPQIPFQKNQNMLNASSIIESTQIDSSKIGLGKQADRQTGRQADGQTDRRASGQTGRQASGQKYDLLNTVSKDKENFPHQNKQLTGLLEDGSSKTNRNFSSEVRTSRLIAQKQSQKVNKAGSFLEKQEVQVYSVTDLNTAIKSQLEGAFPQVWLQGEVSNFSIPPSGHFYFSLKDKQSQIKAVMFKGQNRRLQFCPQNGMEVLVKANVSTYVPRGDYQLICQHIDPIGQGALQAQFEQLKQKLQKEGLFDKARKKKLPAFPQRIALVTSPTGAVIRDLLNILTRRFKGLDITLIPTLVQGENAATEIISAINLAHKVTPVFDIMVVARGGGSIEDLWCFNNEDVVRCIASATIPIISAIGHEVDFTLSDFVSDQRTPTPSAAAELIVPDRIEVQTTIDHLKSRFVHAMQSNLLKNQQKCLGLFKRLKNPQKQLQEFFQRNDELLQRMQRAFSQICQKEHQKLTMLSQSLKKNINVLLTNKRLALKNQAELLDSLSPLKVVARGYCIVKSKEGQRVITSVSEIKPNDMVNITFAKGQAEAEIKNIITSKSFKNK